MPGVVHLVVDTNLFHECRSLDSADFPWSDLGDFDTFELIVSDPVQGELDRQKKDTRSRVKKRAVQAVAWFREMLRSGTREHIFRQQDPRVVMRVNVQTASSDFPELLDLTVDDDRIVGVAVALAKAAPERDIRVLSHDTRPMAKADAVGLRFEFIPESWIREPEADNQAKEIAQLKAEVAELQASHPALAVTAIGAVDRRLSLTREALAALSAAEIVSFRNKISERFSLAAIEEMFADKASSRRPSSFSLHGNLIYVPPSEDAIRRYRHEIYPAWLDGCASQVAGLPSAVNSRTAPSIVTVTLDNTGYRPAENVRIRFTARGPFLIVPPRKEGYNPEFADLPRVPRPPTGQWQHDGSPVAFATSIKNAFNPRLPDISHLRHTGFAREDETWYYEPERPDAPVASFDLECRRFRHGIGSEHFKLMIFPQSHEAVVRGALEVSVNASNVGRPLTVTFPIEVNSAFKSPISYIDSFLAKTKIFKMIRACLDALSAVKWSCRSTGSGHVRVAFGCLRWVGNRTTAFGSKAKDRYPPTAATVRKSIITDGKVPAATAALQPDRRLWRTTTDEQIGCDGNRLAAAECGPGLRHELLRRRQRESRHVQQRQHGSERRAAAAATR